MNTSNIYINKIIRENPLIRKVCNYSKSVGWNLQLAQKEKIFKKQLKQRESHGQK